MSRNRRAVGTVAALIGKAIVIKCSYVLYDIHKLQVLKRQWNGFNSTERGNYNFTVVTGLFDIGRGQWWTSGRSYNTYLGHLLQENNDNYAEGKCEATIPIYNLVTNSKITLVHKAIQLNPFETNYFIWLDGGYGHGNTTYYPPDGIWNPRHLLKFPDKFTFIALRDLQTHAGIVDKLHKVDTALIAGGLFAGGIRAMETFYALHKYIVQTYMDRGSIDDDQTTFADCYYLQPDNFNPVKGDWYDLLKPWS